MAWRSSAWIAFCCAALSVASGVGCSAPNDEADDDDAAPEPPRLDLSTSHSGSSGGSNSSGSGGSSSESSASSGTSGSDGEILGVNGEPGECRSLQIEEGCAGELYEGEVIPLDLYVMFDQSGSMATVIDEATGEMRIDAVSDAMQEFLLDWRSSGIGVGFGHFGHMPLGATSCNEDDYAAPLVSIARLPDNAQPIVDTLKALEPTGETPTGAGIRGACQVTTEWKDDHPGTVVANLIVTDGEPKAPITSEDGSCEPTLKDAVAAAAECADAGVPSYVLGVGPSLENLDSIAQAGGTEGAYLVAEDSSQGVLEALNAIRGAAQLPCEFAADEPAGDRSLNYDETDVVVMDDQCVVRRIGHVASADECDGGSGGWYFDDSTGDRRIVLCERSCADVRQPGTEFFYSVGCGIEPTIY